MPDDLRMPVAPLPGVDARAPWLAFPAPDGLRDLDLALGRFLLRQAPQADGAALRLAVLCSSRVALGHVCLDLRTLQTAPGVIPAAWSAENGARPPWRPGDAEACRAVLARAPFVGDGTGSEPLVLYQYRLYLARYWHASRRIRAALGARLAVQTEESHSPQAARAWLDQVFPPADPAAPDWQRIACANALLGQFSIITGGPGTGKTTTVVRLLTVLQGLAQARNLPAGLRIRLAAPTGKAAARLNESIAAALERLASGADAPLRAALACVPAQVVTLHHLLGSRPDEHRPRFHAGHPLDLDVLVIDEASMMDVEMADAALAAMPAQARLVLLGDRDQLASVEAGAVLGELCARAPAGHYTAAHCARLEALCGVAPALSWQDAEGTALDQAVVMLRQSHRFDERSGIGQFARAVNAGDGGAAVALLQRPPAGLAVVRVAPGGGPAIDWLQACGALDVEGYPALLRLARDAPPAEATPAEAAQAARDQWAAGLLARQGRFQILCALRAGPWGVEGVNQLIEARLRAAGLIGAGAGEWYPGRPVLVTRNQPALGLSNGDIGLVLPVPDPRDPARRMLRVAFAGAVRGAVRWVSPARLPAIETVYALTVHKSQGSEFERVALVLPDRVGPLLARELLYTGATRARTALVLVLPGPQGLLGEAVRHAANRAAGIWDPDA